MALSHKVLANFYKKESKSTHCICSEFVCWSQDNVCVIQAWHNAWKNYNGAFIICRKVSSQIRSWKICFPYRSSLFFSSWLVDIFFQIQKAQKCFSQRIAVSGHFQEFIGDFDRDVRNVHQSLYWGFSEHSTPFVVSKKVPNLPHVGLESSK